MWFSIVSVLLLVSTVIVVALLENRDKKEHRLTPLSSIRTAKLSRSNTIFKHLPNPSDCRRVISMLKCLTLSQRSNFKGGEIMKKPYCIPELCLSLLTFFGFSYGLVAVFKEPGLNGGEKFLVALVGTLGFLTSLFVIGYIIRKNLQKETEIDEAEKDRIREEAYREWQMALAEAEKKCEEAQEKWEEFQKLSEETQPSSLEFKTEAKPE